jgi:hypothetical protein
LLLLYDNLHHLVHEGGWRLHGKALDFTVYRRDGTLFEHITRAPREHRVRLGMGDGRAGIRTSVSRRSIELDHEQGARTRLDSVLHLWRDVDVVAGRELDGARRVILEDESDAAGADSQPAPDRRTDAMRGK